MGILALSTIRDSFRGTNACELKAGRYVIPVGNEDLKFAQSVQGVSPWDRFGFVLNPLFLPTGRTFLEIKSGRRSTVEFNPLKGRVGQVVLDVKDAGFTIVVSEASLIRTTVAQLFATLSSSPEHALTLTVPVCFLDVPVSTNDGVDARPKSIDEVVKLFNSRQRAAWSISTNSNTLMSDLCSFKSATPQAERIHYLRLFSSPSGGVTYKVSS
jgi:hypothetical protein